MDAQQVGEFTAGGDREALKQRAAALVHIQFSDVLTVAMLLDEEVSIGQVLAVHCALPLLAVIVVVAGGNEHRHGHLLKRAKQFSAGLVVGIIAV